MNWLTVNRREGRGGNGGKKGKSFQGTHIKDPWTKPKWRRIKGGWLGWGGSGARKMETTALEQ